MYNMVIKNYYFNSLQEAILYQICTNTHYLWGHAHFVIKEDHIYTCILGFLIVLSLDSQFQWHT